MLQSQNFALDRTLSCNVKPTFGNSDSVLIDNAWRNTNMRGTTSGTKALASDHTLEVAYRLAFPLNDHRPLSFFTTLPSSFNFSKI